MKRIIKTLIKWHCLSPEQIKRLKEYINSLPQSEEARNERVQIYKRLLTDKEYLARLCEKHPEEKTVTLNEDVMDVISQYSKMKDMISFLSCCKTFWNYKGVYFYERVLITGREENPYVKRLKVVEIFSFVKLPPLVTDLAISVKDKEMPENYIPRTVTHLRIGLRCPFREYKRLCVINYNLEGKIPKSVTHLTFTQNTKYPLKGVIPDSVTDLTFDGIFDQSVKDCIPHSVKNLTFQGMFTEKLTDSIPDSVTQLHLKGFYAHPIINVIPKYVKILSFGDFFDQEVNGYLPDTITHLFFGKYFNHPIEKPPKNLLQLVISERYNKDPIFLSDSTVLFLRTGPH